MIFDGKDDPRLITGKALRPCLNCGGEGIVEDKNKLASSCPNCLGTGKMHLPVPKLRVVGSRKGIADDGTLPKQLEIALRDIGSWKDLYLWKQASMRRLEKMGMVERIPNPPRKDIHYWRVTNKGRQWLEMHPRDKV